MKALLAVLLAVSLASVAEGRTWYVSPTGTDTTCANPTSGVGPLSKPNADAHTGDIISMAAGTYSTGIAPARSGTATSTRITYVGALGNQAATVVPTITLAQSYVSVKGVTAGSFGATVSGGSDSLYKCTLSDVTASIIVDQADYTVISTCTLNAARVDIAHETNTLRTRNFQIVASTVNLVQTSDYQQAAWRNTHCDSLWLVTDHINITVQPGGNHGVFKNYFNFNMRVTDCVFDVVHNRPTNNSGYDEAQLFNMRDSTRFAVMLRDTFLLRGPYATQFFMSQAGSYEGTTLSNKWDSCVWRSEALYATDEPLLWWQDGAAADTVINCLVIADHNDCISQYKGPSRSFNSACLIQGNTFIQLGSGSWMAIDSHDGLSASLTTWRDNIYYTRSGYVWNYTQDSDYDLAFSPTKAVGNGIIRSGSDVGFGPGQTGCTSYGKDCNGKWGDPIFVGPASADVYSFDAHLASGSSPALTASHSGGLVGALGYTSVPTAYYVNPVAGSDGNSGTSTAAAWKSISHANWATRPGDRVYLMPGGHIGFPNPDSAGHSPTGNGYITFIGTGTAITDSAARAGIVIVKDTTLVKPYVTIRGVTLAGITVGEAADRDTLAYVTISNRLLWQGADYTLLDHAIVNAPQAIFGTPAGATTGSKVAWCRFWKLGNSTSPGHLFQTANTDSCAFYWNRLAITPAAVLPVANFCIADSASTHMTRRGNRYITSTDSPQRIVWAQYAGCHDNAFAAETLAVANVGGYIYPALDTGDGSTDGLRWGAWKCNVDSCCWNALATSGTQVFWRGGMSAWNLRYDVIATDGCALRMQDLKSKNLVNHCTIVGRPISGYPEKSVVAIVNDALRPTLSDSALTFTNNIVCGQGTNTAGSNPADTTSGAFSFNDYVVDSTSHLVNLVEKTQHHLVSNNNLYCWWGNGASTGDRDWLNFDAPNARRTGAWRTNAVASWWGTDSLSRYGTPAFVDSSQSSFDPRLNGWSAAVGIGTSGSDAGAVAYGNAAYGYAWPNEVNLYLSRTGTAGASYIDVACRSGLAGIAIVEPPGALGQQLHFYNGSYTDPSASWTDVGYGEEAQSGAGDVLRFPIALNDGATLTGDITVYASISDGGTTAHPTQFVPILIHVRP